MQRKLGLLAAIVMVVGLAALACTTANETALRDQRADQTQAQIVNQNRAIASVPIPQPEQFTTRTQVARWMAEMDKPAQTWYMYAFMEGFAEPIALFIADAPATPYCAFMTPPEQVFRSESSNEQDKFVVQAPGLDGVYWGSGDCYSYQYFWDESTGLMIQVQDFKLMMANGRLSFLDVPEIKVLLTVSEVPPLGGQ